MDSIPELTQIQVGTKLKCVSNTHGYVKQNNHLLIIGQVYTVDSMYLMPPNVPIPQSNLRFKFTLTEINDATGELPYYVADDFVIVEHFDAISAWDRAMKGI